MSQITKYISAIILMFSISLSSQTSMSDDPEIIQNIIDYKVSQAQIDIENSDYFEAEKSFKMPWY